MLFPSGRLRDCHSVEDHLTKMRQPSTNFNSKRNEFISVPLHQVRTTYKLKSTALPFVTPLVFLALLYAALFLTVSFPLRLPAYIPTHQNNNSRDRYVYA